MKLSTLQIITKDPAESPESRVTSYQQHIIGKFIKTKTAEI